MVYVEMGQEVSVRVSYSIVSNPILKPSSTRNTCISRWRSRRRHRVGVAFEVLRRHPAKTPAVVGQPRQGGFERRGFVACHRVRRSKRRRERGTRAPSRDGCATVGCNIRAPVGTCAEAGVDRQVVRRSSESGDTIKLVYMFSRPSDFR